MTRIRAALAAAATDLAPEVIDRLAEAATEAAFRVRWDKNGWASLGSFYMGKVHRTNVWNCVPRVLIGYPSEHPTESAARAALERAVMEAVNGQ